MEERRAAGDDLDRVLLHLERREKRHRVALGVEDVDGPATAPLPAFRIRFRPAAPHGGGRDALVVFARAEKHLPDLEQGDVARAPARIALGGGDKARNQARAHVGKVGRDWVGEGERRGASAERFRRALGDEGPGHRLAQGERRQRALGEAGALLHEGQHRPRHAVIEPGQGRGQRPVDAGDAQDLLHDIGLDLHVGAPGGDEHMGPLDAEAEPAENRLALVARDIDAEEPLHFAVRERDHAPRR